MKKKYLAAAMIFGAAALICGGIGVYKYFQDKNAGTEYDEIRKEVVQQAEEETPEEEPAVQQEMEEPAETTVEIPIDFTALKEQNPDVYAWIQVPGTAVDYPILQSPTDNAYCTSCSGCCCFSFGILHYYWTHQRRPQRKSGRYLITNGATGSTSAPLPPTAI